MTSRVSLPSHAETTYRSQMSAECSGAIWLRTAAEAATSPGSRVTSTVPEIGVTDCQNLKQERCARVCQHDKIGVDARSFDDLLRFIPEIVQFAVALPFGRDQRRVVPRAAQPRQHAVVNAPEVRA